jgi:rare lipoprotein A
MALSRSPKPFVAALGVTLWLASMASAHGAPHHRRPHIDRSARAQTGRASYEGHGDTGKKTASGARFRPTQMTAASRTLPLGTKAKVTDAATGRSVDVTVTDRGPFAKHRILDVSPRAADQLGMKEKGTATVKVQPLQEPRKPG